MNSSATMNLDGNSWLLSTDPENVGRNLRWYDEVTGEAKATRVPGIIQETFPTYHGVVWYWHEFTPPDNPHEDGRYLLNFWQVDYLADVWVNGKYVGQHEGTGDPFTLDVTEPILPRAVNRVAVRVLNPKNEPIDGISLMESPVWARGIPCTPGLALNYGGITDSVELHIVPAVRVTDLFVKPDWKTGNVRVGASLYNARNRDGFGRTPLFHCAFHQREYLEFTATAPRDSTRRDTCRNRVEGRNATSLGAQRSLHVSYQRQRPREPISVNR